MSATQRLKCSFCDGFLIDQKATGDVIGWVDEEGENIGEDEWGIAYFECEKCEQLHALDQRDTTYFLKTCTCSYGESEEMTSHSKYCSSVSEFNPWNKK